MPSSLGVLIISLVLFEVAQLETVVPQSLDQNQGAPQSVPAIKVVADDLAVLNNVGQQLVQSRNTDPPNPMINSPANEDSIVRLDYSSLADNVLGKNTANFVYFNANFNHCRHCSRFYDVWKKLANNIKWWQQIIKLFVIDCSDEDNIEMCRKAGVSQFPQVKYYWIMSNSLDQDGQRLRVLGKSVHAMRHLIMDRVLDSYAEHVRLLKRKSQLQSQPVQAKSSNTLSSSPQFNPLGSLMAPFIDQFLSSPGGGGLSALSSMLGLPAGASSLLNGLVTNLGGPQSVGQVMSAFLSATSLRNVLPIPANWPELEPIVVENPLQLYEILPLSPNKNVGAILIMETQEYLYTGPEVMLDLIPFSNQTYIARVKDDRSQLIKSLTKRDDVHSPALIYVSPSRELRLLVMAPKYSDDEDLRRTFVKTFEKSFVKAGLKRSWSVAGSQSKSADTPETQLDEDAMSRINSVHMDDLTNALRISLMEQVFRHPDLTDDQLGALIKYVYIVINYFPFPNDDSLRFVRRLHGWLQNQVSPIDVAEYRKQFHDVDKALPVRDWQGCRSLSSSKTVPRSNQRFNTLDSPNQFGKVVSNVTRFFRAQQKQMGKLKGFLGAISSNVGSQNSTTSSTTTTSTTDNQQSVVPSSTSKPSAKSDDSSFEESFSSPVERIIKGLMSGSLGSDSSILKFISTALTGGATGESPKRSKFARDYPCGMWNLAHVMVVNEFIKDSPRKDVKHIVLQGLYQYMTSLYACPTCGNRVSDVAGEFRINFEDQLDNQGDSIILLWKLHNRVNRRLEGESRPGSPPKVQFPDENLCPRCRDPRDETDLTSTPNWNERQVSNFLIHHFRNQSIVASTSDSSSSSASSAHNTSLPSHYIITVILIYNYHLAMLIRYGQ